MEKNRQKCIRSCEPITIGNYRYYYYDYYKKDGKVVSITTKKKINKPIGSFTSEKFN